MIAFTQSTAKVASWNLAGFQGLTAERLDRQAEGLGLLDAEVVALVEINPESALDGLRTRLHTMGVDYHSAIIPQTNKLKIGLLYKAGVSVEHVRLLEGSDGGDPDRRKAFIANITVGKFDFQLIVVHLKSGRGVTEQKFRDKQCQGHRRLYHATARREPGRHFTRRRFQYDSRSGCVEFSSPGRRRPDRFYFLVGPAGSLFTYFAERPGEFAGRFCHQP